VIIEAADVAATMAVDAASVLPDPDATQPPGTSAVDDIMGWLKWVCLVACIAGIMIAGALMAIQSRRGEGGEHAGKIAWALGAAILITGATSLVGFVAF